jgi:hypothetical protein
MGALFVHGRPKKELGVHSGGRAWGKFGISGISEARPEFPALKFSFNSFGGLKAQNRKFTAPFRGRATSDAIAPPHALAQRRCQ